MIDIDLELANLRARLMDESPVKEDLQVMVKLCQDLAIERNAALERAEAYREEAARWYLNGTQSATQFSKGMNGAREVVDEEVEQRLLSTKGEAGEKVV